MIIYGNTSQSASPARLEKFLHSLSPLASERGAGIYAPFLNYLIEKGVNVPDWIDGSIPMQEADFLISLGGDGTLLHAACWSASARLPILGVNTGHLGYLTAYDVEQGELLVDELMHDLVIEEARMLVGIEAAGIPEPIWPFALNEIAILKADTSSMINIRTLIDGIYLTDYLADGLLISTPTGSTGYNLSVGGPIIQPSMNCMALSPIAPHTLTMRPLVVRGDSRIKLLVDGRTDKFRVSLDGRSFILPTQSEIEICACGEPLRLMRRANQDFASTLRGKLSWGN